MRRNDAAGIVAYVAFLLTASAFASLSAGCWQVSFALFAVDTVVCVAGGLLFGRAAVPLRRSR